MIYVENKFQNIYIVLLSLMNSLLKIKLLLAYNKITQAVC